MLKLNFGAILEPFSTGSLGQSRFLLTTSKRVKTQSMLQLHHAEMALIGLETVRKQHKNNSSWIMAVEPGILWRLFDCFCHVTLWTYTGWTSFSCCFCQNISEPHNSIPPSCKGATKTSYGYWVLMNIYSLLVISHGTLLLPLGWIPQAEPCRCGAILATTRSLRWWNDEW